MNSYPDLFPPPGAAFPWRMAALLLAGFSGLALAQWMGLPQTESFAELKALLLSVLPADLWSELTHAGDLRVLLCLLSPLLLIRPMLVYALLAAAPAGGLASVILKRLFQAARPEEISAGIAYAVEATTTQRYDSFPSGHAMTVFAVLGIFLGSVVGSHVRRIWLIALVLAGSVIALAAMSRVALGVHWPRDVAAGAILGCLLGRVGISIVRACAVQLQSHRLNLAVHALIVVLGFLTLREAYSDPGSARLQQLAVLMAAGSLSYRLIWWGGAPRQ